MLKKIDTTLKSKIDVLYLPLILGHLTRCKSLPYLSQNLNMFDTNDPHELICPSSEHVNFTLLFD